MLQNIPNDYGHLLFDSLTEVNFAVMAVHGSRSVNLENSTLCGVNPYYWFII